MALICMTEPVREKSAEWLAKHFLSAIAEDLFGRRIEEDDPLFMIDCDDAIRCRMHYTREPRLAFGQRMSNIFCVRFVAHWRPTERF